MSSSTEAAGRDFQPVRFCLRDAEPEAAPPVGGAAREPPWGEITVTAAVDEPPAGAERATERRDDPSPGERPLLFDETEVARICAGVARRAAEGARATAARQAEELRTAALVAFEARLAELAAGAERAWREVREQLAEVTYGMVATALPILVRRLHREEVTGAVRELLDRLGPEAELRIRVHPELAEDLDRWLGGRSGETGERVAWQVVADGELAPGDFRIERRHGFLERRAEEICAAILEAVRAVLAPGDTATVPNEPASTIDTAAREQRP